MAIIVRLLQNHESNLANSFFNQVYGVNRSPEHFDWEFINGPFGKAIYIVALDDASPSDQPKVVGIQCAIPIEFIHTDGNAIRTAKSEDTLVDPNYRGQKIFERMYELLFEECRKAGIKYIWGFTPAQKAFERIGFEIPFKTEQALVVYNPIAAYRYLKNLNAKNTTTDKLKILGLSLLAWVKGFSMPSRSLNLVEVPILDKTDLFGTLYRGKNYYGLNENSAYLKWRLLDNPFGNHYQCFQLNHEGEVLADVIVNHRENVSYVEQLYYRADIDVDHLLRTLSKKCRAEGANLLRAFCFSTNEILSEQGQAISSAGFTYLKRGSFFVWKSLDPANQIKPEQLLLNRLFTQGNL